MADIDETKINEALGKLDELMSKTDLSKVSAESSGSFENLPDGYYLSELEKAEFTISKQSGEPMIALVFHVTEDGIGAIVDEHGFSKHVDIKNTINRKIFLYYVLKDEKSLQRFTSDMLKFEGDEPGKPILGEEYYTNGAELLLDALEILVGLKVYINVSTTVKDGESKTWQNIISWNRATKLELPC